jgi:uncharacterized peroxidase-related enzyme
VRLTKNLSLAQNLIQNYATAEITPRQRAMLDYAVKLTQSPGAMRQGDIQMLRAHGLTDRDILDVNQVTAYFAYVNRVADGLGVTVDDYANDQFRSVELGSD